MKKDSGQICTSCWDDVGPGYQHNCTPGMAVANMTKRVMGLGQQKAEHVATNLLKEIMEGKNIARGEKFKLSTGSIGLSQRVNVTTS